MITSYEINGATLVARGWATGKALGQALKAARSLHAQGIETENIFGELDAVLMDNSMRLPVSVAGALMPDAHVGCDLPIGGVLATEGAVIPYAVGVDIACRMRLSMLDASPIVLNQQKGRFEKVLQNNTRFGAGVEWKPLQDDEVMDDPDWDALPLLRGLKDKGSRQLGTSGSGNQFVKWRHQSSSHPQASSTES